MSDQFPSTQAATPARIGLHEGSVCLPAGFEDRTTNLFVPMDPQSQPNLSIARDWFAPGETLATYVDRQLGILKARMPGHKLLGRQDERLGLHDVSIAGERIEAQYKNGAQVIRQRQAAFDLGNGRVLVFTAATPRAFDEQFDALWRDWLASFRPAASPADGADQPHVG
ncbi:DUF1795 domain-containing protein [Massilia forsythiae]|uniref:DUF1795 domain-containing protein n=1 Tax=Massilia forsythiae TaxID=2728020 RepID=A0A7Z2VVL1_9BURK|nr:DUF1795 domain-containing protein [Massilia forsythiae]QJE00293.1 DUF1795 domain-containing protein [Massilia forsythiae]